MEKLYVLGTGNATAFQSYNTCFALCDENNTFLVDAGGGNGILTKLSNAGIHLTDIQHIFVSHKHMDHCLGVLWIIRVLSVSMAKGDYSGKLWIYGDESVLAMLDRFCKEMLREKFYQVIGRNILWVPVEDGEVRQIGDWEIRFFDIGSVKTKQLGFKLRLCNGKTLVFTGDEPLKPVSVEIGRGADWLLREVLCCYEDEEQYHAYEKKHDTVKEACQQSIEMGVRHAVLWHVEDKTDVSMRKEKYQAEAKKWLKEFASDGTAVPEILVPDDGEIIEL